MQPRNADNVDMYSNPKAEPCETYCCPRTRCWSAFAACSIVVAIPPSHNPPSVHASPRRCPPWKPAVTIRTTVGRIRANFGQFLASSGRLRASGGRTWPTSDHVWSILRLLWSSLAQKRPELAQQLPMPGQSCRCWPKSPEISPQAARVRPGSAFKPNSTRIRPIWGECGQMFFCLPEVDRHERSFAGMSMCIVLP